MCIDETELPSKILTGKEDDEGSRYTSNAIGCNLSLATYLPVRWGTLALIRWATKAPVPKLICRFGHARPEPKLAGAQYDCLSIASRLLGLVGRQVCTKDLFWKASMLAGKLKRMLDAEVQTLNGSAQRRWNRVCHGTKPLSREVMSCHLIAQC